MAVKCPSCKQPVEEGKSRFFPFCSERCKLIDLGRWLDGKYQIPVVEPDEGDDIAARDEARDRARRRGDDD